MLRAFKDEHINCRKQAFKGYVRIGQFNELDVDIIEALIKSERDLVINFYGWWVLAQLGRKRALLNLAKLLAKDSFLGIEDLFDTGYLNEHQILEKLNPLIVPNDLTSSANRSAVHISTHKEWGEWIHKHQAKVMWDDAQKAFRL